MTSSSRLDGSGEDEGVISRQALLWELHRSSLTCYAMLVGVLRFDGTTHYCPSRLSIVQASPMVSTALYWLVLFASMKS
jgi:hypothetical protein